MSKEIIPFGKYKGNTIEQLAVDKQYASWLMEQEWFRQRFAHLYRLLTTIQIPSETPEHNKLQAKFMDRNFCQGFAEIYGIKKLFQQNIDDHKKWFDNLIEMNIKDVEKLSEYSEPKINKKFEFEGFDVALTIYGGYSTSNYYNNHAISCLNGNEMYEKVKSQEKNKGINSFHSVFKGWLIELKPTLGDEYPSVIRQVTSAIDAIRRTGNLSIRPTSEERVRYYSFKNMFGDLWPELVVLIEEFTASSVDYESVKAIFKTREIQLVQMSEILF